MGKPTKEKKVKKVAASAEEAPAAVVEKVVKPKKEKKQKPVAEKAAEPEVMEVDTAASTEKVENTDAPAQRKRSFKERKALAKEKKRAKLDEVFEPKLETVQFDPADNKGFSDFELDERILKGVGELGWERPTQIQESMIALALEDKNLMARARTGSGKTAAFVLPLLHKVIMYASSTSSLPPGPYAMFIAPTKELATQAAKLLSHLLKPLPFLHVLNLSELSETEKDVWMADQPELLVTTPGKLNLMLSMRPDFCANVRHVVLDEADLLLSYGYEEEMIAIKKQLPASYQCIFTSATLSDDMSQLKKMYMTGAVVTIKLKEGDLPSSEQLQQYQITCENDEQRFAILLSMIKLRLIVGKSIIFVNDTDRCYQLNLFLAAFGVNSCILNSSMPANSRCHVIEQFNAGKYTIVIASDMAEVSGERLAEQKADFGADADDGEEKKEKKKRVRVRGRKLDKESGVARGIDFHHVANVVNFDFPTTVENYIHRVGRTARGWNKGTALSFASPEERPQLDAIQDYINERMGYKALIPYEIRIKELETFLLRTRSALDKCGKAKIREARLAEIRAEALKSTKLQAYFARNPRERDLLITDRKHATLQLHSPGIGDVPDYMVPKALRGTDYSNKTKRNRHRNRHEKRTQGQKKFQKKSKDPLQSFKV